MSTAGVEYEVVANQVRVLRILVDEFLDDVHPTLLSTRNNQDTYRWTNLSQCQGFRRQYKASIDSADIELRAVWEDIKNLAANLQAAAASMSELDQSVSDDLRQLLARIENETPSAYSGNMIYGVPVEIYYGGSDGYVPGSGTPVADDSSQEFSDGTV